MGQNSNTGIENDVNYNNTELRTQYLDNPARYAEFYMQFDLSGIPNGADVTAATLTLECFAGQPHPRPNQVHRIDEDWVETVPTWGVAGADRLSVADFITSTDVANPGTKTWDLLTAVQNWNDGTWANQGFRMWWDATHNSTARKFRSSGYATAADRPKLDITYTPIDPPITAGNTAILMLRRRTLI